MYSFSTKEYELVLRLCPKGPPSNWEREKKNIKLRVKPKDGKKKCEIFAQEMAQVEATRFELISTKFL